jgi:glycosyltransferase involved in cell wall biosynthesis
VSVVVPCYNYGHFLRGCVASVLQQHGVDVRLLVIDDCSTDDSADVAALVCESDVRVEFRRHRQNAGLIRTANEGLEWADGDYVVLLSADDLLVPGALYRATSIMDRHPEVGLVYGRPLVAREGRELPPSSGRWRSTRVWAGEDWIRTRCKTAHNAMSSPEVVVRNKVQQQVGRYDMTCYHTSDLNMWLRVAAVSDIARVRGVPQAIYRVHTGSMLRSQDGPLVDLRDRRAAFESFFRDYGSFLQRPEELAVTAGRTLAREALWLASRTVDRGVQDEQSQVDELVGFALEVCPDARRLREWHGLRLRRQIGSPRSRIFPPFLAARAARRLTAQARSVRWRFHGI